MKLTAKMKNTRKESFIDTRTRLKVKPIKELVNFIYSDRVSMHKTETLLDLVAQIDRVTSGQEFKVTWYTLDNNYLQVNIAYNNITFYFYCKEVLNTLENFLHVNCKIEEKIVSMPAETSTYRNIVCIKDN